MRLSCALILISLVACGDDSTLPILDAGVQPDVFDSGPAPDVFDGGPPPDVFDAGPPPEPSRLFGACVIDSQCPGEGAFCRLPEDGFSEGQCSVPCVDRRPCDDTVTIHWCIEAEDREGSACEFRCLNSVDCGRGDNYVCVEIGQREAIARGGRCVGYCDEDADCGFGSECNEQAATCVAAGTTPTEGALTNEACESDDQCLSGSCTPAVSNGVPTGEVGGSCRTLCTIPAGFQSSNFYLGDTLPTDECPNPGDICLPVGDLSVGSEGNCYAACEMDSDCRPGRACLRTIAEHRFTNGVCIPIDCRSDACPADHTCVDVNAGGGNVVGRCQPN